MAKRTKLRGLEREGPVGLRVETLVAFHARAADDELAIFEWSAAPVAPAPALTVAESEVLRLVASGSTNAQIAKARRVSVRTVANQVARLLAKLGAESRFDLIRRFGHGEKPAR